MVFALIFLGLFVGFLSHAYLSRFQTLLTNADSFAYLQMSHHLSNLSIEGLGTGWFGFLYSASIAIPDFLFHDSFYSAHFINLFLFLVGGIILYFIAERYLHYLYSFLLIILYGLSTPLLYYNTNILSENLYIPLFLGFFLLVIRYFEKEELSDIFFAGLVLGAMYLTRSEAFIYGAPVALIILCISIARKETLKKYLLSNIVFVVGFLILAFPYMYYLNTITGEWGLTNKGSSNIRQAMMRSVNEMDDAGFEKAVGELTDDKKSLKAGFVGGLKYAPSDKEYTLEMLIGENPEEFKQKWKDNIIKLVTKIMPKMVIGDALYYIEDTNFTTSWWYSLYIGLLVVPIFFITYGFMMLYIDRRRYLLLTFIPLFATASIFFTMFFVLERYFIIFLPILLIFLVYGVQSFLREVEIIQVPRTLIFGVLVIGVYGLGMRYFIDHVGEEEQKYEIKKEVGQWLKENKEVLFPGKENIRIMERFPILTYYAGSWERYITPYANQSDIIEYAKQNDIDILVVDTLDFRKYRPDLIYLLDPKSILKKKEFVPLEYEVGSTKTSVWLHAEEKVVLYKINYSK